MSRKRPTPDQMDQLMSQPHFRRDEAVASTDPSHAPATTTPMLVDVDQIVPYDRNPRRSPNDKRDELKAYIWETGFNQVLTITQRPDTDHPELYMIGVGGNTRLRLVQELWHETGDARFQQVWCQFQPWTGETQTLVAHIQDNDLRGELIFIDRAIAVQELRDMLEAEAGQSLSQRALRDRLAERGYPISRTMIGWYQYTVDTLFPLIPALLQTGMGRPTITKIYDLQKAFGKAWQSLDLGEAEAANNLFEQTLQRHDGEAFDPDRLRRDLEEELSVSADCDMQRASLEFGGALHGRSDIEIETPSDTNRDDTARTAPETGQSAGAPDTHAKQCEGSDSGPPHRNDSAEDSRTARPGTTDSCPIDEEDHAADVPSPAATDASLPRDLKSLRSRAWTLASRIAQGSRLGDIVLPIRDGLGFLVGPVALETQQSWTPDVGRRALCVWWHLATLAEQFARHGRAGPYMPDTWRQRRIGDAMRQARDGQQAFSQWQWQQADRDLFADVPPLEPNDLGPMLYQNWAESRWHDWIRLVETYRAIYRTTGDAPWGDDDARR